MRYFMDSVVGSSNNNSSICIIYVKRKITKADMHF